MQLALFAHEMHHQAGAVAVHPGQRQAGVHQLRAGEYAALFVELVPVPEAILRAGGVQGAKAIAGVPVKAAQAHQDGLGVRAGSRLHIAQQRFILALADELPGAEVGFLRIAEAVVIAVVDEVPVPLDRKSVV